MATYVRGKITLDDWAHFRPNSDGSAEPELHESTLLNDSRSTSFVDVEAFLEQVDRRLGEIRRCGSLGYVEMLTHEGDRPIDAFVEQHRADIVAVIDNGMNGKGIFCWYAGRFIVLLDKASANVTRSTFTSISRGIAERVWRYDDSEVHATPIIGYSDLILTGNARELWSMAEAALSRAKISLEIEPVRYGWRMSRDDTPHRFSPSRLWRLAPQRVVLGFQFLVSLILGLGAPFIFYAVCDALGSDISGPVYIGVVVVLVVTATTIWIEGFLALKATTPPVEPGAPYPRATIIIPAYLPNEAETIIETLHAFLKLDYANAVQIIVAYNTPIPHMPVEDEIERLAASCAVGGKFLIEPVRVEGSTSKAQNVNAVVGRVRGRFVGIFDADHHPHADSLQRAWRWLSNGWDIVQGRCSIRNGADTWISRMVAIEFEQIYAVSHPGRARFHGFGIFGGSNGFWRTPVLHETRMRHSMLTEDIDSSIRAVVAGYKITGDRDLISEELAPTVMKQLLNQRLRWAQGWFQVSFRRVMPALMSPKVSVRQKLGLVHLLVWRELFPWYSIQVLPIMAYWILIYGWNYVHWAIPIFLATTIYTVSTGPGQIILAYLLAHKPMKKNVRWFFEYLLVSTFFFSPFKDALSRIAHVKEAMGERAWKVTPRVAPASRRGGLSFIGRAAAVLLLVSVTAGTSYAQSTPARSRSPGELIATLLGGEASTINAARVAAHEGRNADAARLFAKAIETVPNRRAELLHEYADALTYSGGSARAVPLYRELLSSERPSKDRWTIVEQLALALTWSGQEVAALATYDRLAAHDPGNTDLAAKRARLKASLGSGPNRVNVPRVDVVTAIKSEPKTLHDYRMAIARTTPGSAESWRMQHGLAVALSASKENAAALDAWTKYLRHSPTDTDAMLNRARALADLHQHDRSLEAFKLAYANDPQNVAARTGARDETVALARAAAQEDHNAEAQALFANAIKLDPSRRRELLREYADQLSFTHQTAVAIPLYVEWLDGIGQSVADRKQAMLGLANAYVWSGNAKEAEAAYAQLASTFPNDRAIHWTVLVFSARNAARTDRNQESARLFAEAIAFDADRSGVLLREYADQLSFTKRAAQAIPVYVQYLSNPALPASDRLAADKALAQAYVWADRAVDAEAAYAQLSARYPDALEFKWDLLTVSAREAAKADRNSEAATLFAQAIKLDPNRSRGILREYADQLTFTQRPANAIGFYQAALTQQEITDADRLTVKKSLARAFVWSGKLADATKAYEELMVQYPGDTSLRWNYLVVCARAAANADRNAEAADLLEKAIELIPARRSDILKEYADKLTFAGKPKQAIPLYEELLVEDRPLGSISTPRSAHDRTPAGMRDIRLSLAMALSWDKQRAAAMREYQQLVDADPDDIKAGLGVAQMLSWSGRQSDAIVAYQRLLDRHPNNSEVQRGVAQAQDWEGHHREAQATLQHVLEHHPNDVEARRLLAQSLASSGRPDKAIEEVRRALQLQNRHLDGPQSSPLSLRQAKSSAPVSNGVSATLIAREELAHAH